MNASTSPSLTTHLSLFLSPFYFPGRKTCCGTCTFCGTAACQSSTKTWWVPAEETDAGRFIKTLGNGVATGGWGVGCRWTFPAVPSRWGCFASFLDTVVEVTVVTVDQRLWRGGCRRTLAVISSRWGCFASMWDTNTEVTDVKVDWRLGRDGCRWTAGRIQ